MGVPAGAAARPRAAGPSRGRCPTTRCTDGPLPEGWDARVVTEATEGLIAADSTSRIIAVSPKAAASSGTTTPRSSSGQRIVSIVPERFRQAHVAGFTMYLLVGRKPLLDRTVAVPALRRDGSEVEVELTVRSPEAGNGEAVLLADIRAVD